MSDFVGSIISGIFIYINILICYGVSVDVCIIPGKITLTITIEIQEVVLGFFSGNWVLLNPDFWNLIWKVCEILILELLTDIGIERKNPHILEEMFRWYMASRG